MVDRRKQGRFCQRITRPRGVKDGLTPAAIHAHETHFTFDNFIKSDGTSARTEQRLPRFKRAFDGQISKSC
jgi:hypothetical protein